LSRKSQAAGFDWTHFQRFLNALRISTKEAGMIRLGKRLLGTQQRWMTEVRAGMELGIREFVTLKCRQIGVSTISLALDLYFAFRHPGLNGVLVTHDEPSREQFRSILDTYYEGLGEDWRKTRIDNNRNQSVFENGSRLLYRVAGLKEKSAKSLGRSAALAFGHMTEPAFYGDPAQISGLKASFAEHNPVRFYHWESTANGFNHFNRMWLDAKKSITQRCIFISWWANEYYRAAEGSTIYKSYWGKSGRLTPEEREWGRDIERLYGVKVDHEQVAWYRYMASEKITDEMELAQEFPHTENHAFVATGSQFFTAVSLNDAYQRVLHESKPQTYRIATHKEFTDTQLLAVPERLSNLQVWEEPVPKGQAHYVMGADPAYGSTESSDQFALTVYRAYANRMEQVCEFASASMSTVAFAWVIAYLAGAYEPCTVNLEIDGPGESVLNELQNLKKGASFPVRYSSDAPVLRNVTRAMSAYLYRRIDSISGIPQAMHTQTNTRMKERMFNAFKDNFERGILVPHSRALLDEMQGIRRHDGDIQPAATGSDTDDRCLATALAALAWNDQLRTRLIAQGVIWQPPAERRLVQEAPLPVAVRMVQDYLYAIGVTRPVETQKRQVSLGGRAPPNKYTGRVS
jgi:hypothetical protein